MTGTALGLDGSQVPIEDGTIDGDKITYKVTFNVGGMSLEFDYTGVVARDQITLTAEFMGMPFEFVVKRSDK